MREHPSIARIREILTVARDGDLRALLEYWLSIHPADRLPARRDFDPLEVPKALPRLVLTEVERDPYRFKVRLMGTAVAAAIGADFTGSYLDDVWPDAENQPLHLHRVEVAETGLPNYRYGFSPTPFRLDFAPVERIYLPLAGDGATVDMILAMAIHLAHGS